MWRVPENLVLYSNGSQLRIGSDVELTGLVVAPDATINVYSRSAITGCIGGRNVNLEPPHRQPRRASRVAHSMNGVSTGTCVEAGEPSLARSPARTRSTGKSPPFSRAPASSSNEEESWAAPKRSIERFSVGGNGRAHRGARELAKPGNLLFEVHWRRGRDERALLQRSLARRGTSSAPRRLVLGRLGFSLCCLFGHGSLQSAHGLSQAPSYGPLIELDPSHTHRQRTLTRSFVRVQSRERSARARRAGRPWRYFRDQCSTSRFTPMRVKEPTTWCR